jgi:hypothetical protein
MKIEQEHVHGSRRGVQQGAGFRESPGQAHPVPELFEVRAQQETNVGLVVHDEDVPGQGYHEIRAL